MDGHTLCRSIIGDNDDEEEDFENFTEAKLVKMEKGWWWGGGGVNKVA